MGNIRSVLGDCTFREVPEYIKHFVPHEVTVFETRKTKSARGDETYIVYAENSALPEEQPGCSNQRNKPIGVAKQSLSQSLHKRGPEEEQINKQILSDLVEICIGGVEDSVEQPKSTNQKLMSGGKVYQLPQASNSKPLRTEVWESERSLIEAEGEENDFDVEGDSKEREVELENKSPFYSIMKSKSSLPSAKETFSMNNTSHSIDNIQYGKMEELQVHNDSVGTIISNTGAKEIDPRLHEKDAADEMSNAKRNSSVDYTMVRLHVCREEEIVLRRTFTIIAFPFEMDEESKGISKWYIVEAGWFRRWSKFLQGLPRPGPITNEILLNEEGEPKSGLKPGEHYFGIDQDAWNQLSDRYGADLAIARSKYDIYICEE